MPPADPANPHDGYSQAEEQGVSAAAFSDAALAATLVLHSLDAVLLTSPDGSILAANPAACQLFGYREAELHALGAAARDTLLDPSDAQLDVGLAERQATGRFVGTLRCRRKDGSAFLGELSSALFTTADGTPRVATLIRDVTAREAARHALAASEARARAVLEAIPDAILISDRAGQIRQLNGQAERLFGYTPAELLGQPIEVLLPERFRNSHIGQRSAYSDAPSVREMGAGLALTARRRDGSELPVAVRLSPVRLDGEVLVISAVRDITAQRQAETALHQASAAAEQAARQQRFLAEAGTVLASSLDFAATLQTVAGLAVPTLGDWCFVDILREDGVVERVAGESADPSKAAIAQSLREQHLPELSSSEGVGKVLRTGQPELVREWTPARRAAVARHPEQVAVSYAVGLESTIYVPLVVRGRTLGVITLSTATPGWRYTDGDVTVAMELATRAALAIENALLYQEATAAVRQREEVLATIAHDLGQPLTALQGYTQLLLRQAARAEVAATASLRPRLEQLNRAVDEMAAMVSELLDAARLQANRPVDLHYSEFDLVALLRQQLETYQDMTTQHRLRLECAEETLYGSWDRIRLIRVIANLLSNAIKYSPLGGDIVVSLERIRADGGWWAQLRVRDAGIGIPAAELPRVFQRFYRASNVRERIPGTGIGLAGAKQLIEQHGGRLNIASAEGAGTTVTIDLPLDPETDTSRPPRSAGAVSSADQRLPVRSPK